MTPEETKFWKEKLSKAGWKELDTDLGILWKHPDSLVKFTFTTAIDEYKNGKIGK